MMGKILTRGRMGLEAFVVPPCTSDASTTGLKQAQDLAKAKVEGDDNSTVMIPDSALVFESLEKLEVVTQFSSDGSKLAVAVLTVGVTVYDTASGAILMQKEHPSVQALSFTPGNQFLLSWQRHEQGGEGNLIVWSVDSGEIHARFSQRQYSRELWPSICYTADGKLCARMVSNELHFYSGDDIAAGVIDKIRQPNIKHFAVAPAGPAVGKYYIATFIPELKGKPAGVYIYCYPDLTNVITSKHFFKAEEVKLNWSPIGNALIVQTHTSVDKTGESYYGESSIYMLASDASFDCVVPKGKDGPVGDVQWSPSGKVFVVVAGKTPAKATLFDAKCNPLCDFGEAPRNIVSWSPHGRFLVIAGFGNLAGDADFWDTNKLKKMGSTNLSCTVKYGWSPDSRYFMTATTHPRLRVDNNVKIYRYNGDGPLCTKDEGELYDAQWVPAAPGVHPDRPQSPGRKRAKVYATLPSILLRLNFLYDPHRHLLLAWPVRILVPRRSEPTAPLVLLALLLQ
jgi:translation initiation factor 2A